METYKKGEYKMKKFENPEISVEKLEIQDVIATSPNDCKTEGVGGNDGDDF